MSTLAALSVALPPIVSPDPSLHVVFHNDSALDPAAPIACLTIAAPPSLRTSFLCVALRLEQAPLSPSSLPCSPPSLLALCRCFLDPYRRAKTPITLRIEPRQHLQRNTHALSFRFCPRTRTLLRRQLAKLDSGRLVLPNRSPLPMTRHAGGVAGHFISQSNAVLCVPEHPTTTVPSICVLPRSTHSKPRTELHLSSPLPRFEPADHDEPTHDSSSPHAASLPNSAPSPKHVVWRRNRNQTHSPRIFSPCNSCTFHKFHQMLLDFLFDRTMRKSLHEVITALNRGNTDDLLSRLPSRFTRQVVPPGYQHARSPPSLSCPFV
ncbi:hypothetical protein GGX14DRAFT_562787 [Mycena pura]|uniref:Uncharacterized protein n=1 Tax=Mycena pura TaxID=153505 RepID=A0AAD6YI99_9AGAR|nr:hypothetical protein GGX14DRAFT_562787 [Mycena pura]